MLMPKASAHFRQFNAKLSVSALVEGWDILLRISKYKKRGAECPVSPLPNTSTRLALYLVGFHKLLADIQAV